MGWNNVYDFNDSDFLFSEKLVRKMVDVVMERGSGQSMQWDAIKYIIAEINYGGRVTDEMDRRQLVKYAEDTFREEVVSTVDFPQTKYKPDPEYKIPQMPADEVQQYNKRGMGQQQVQNMTEVIDFHITFIDTFPSVEVPGIFGQHINAEISSQIADANQQLDSIICLQPKEGGEQGNSKQNVLGAIIDGILQKIPENINYDEAYARNRPGDGNPLKIVLMQEISRYNLLLEVVRSNLFELDNGLKGKVLIGDREEVMLNSIFENKVPPVWKYAYHSLKPLNSWVADLNQRIEMFQEWAFKQQPPSFWISGFTFPTGFTTALQQQAARKLNKSIDSLKWEFAYLTSESNVGVGAKEGAYVHGFYLEGAKWDLDKIIDAEPMTLHYKMPVVHFKPVDKAAKQANKNIKYYQCPCYVYPIRGGTKENPSYLFSISLPMGPDPNGQIDEIFWIKRGTACLMSLAD